jgi:hypothetical protein
VECTTGIHCTEPTRPLCVNFACSGCTSDAQCAPFVCEQDTGRCRCTEDGQCAPRVCNDATGSCVDCLEDGDCTQDPGRPRCVGERCVECRDKADCTDAQKPFCNGNVCQAMCDDDGDCSPQVCKVSTGQCVACTTDAHCSQSPAGPRCDTATNTCVQCLGDADCAAEPVRKRCQPGTYRCVECLGNSDCGPYGVCSSRNLCICKPCENDSNCGGGRCITIRGEKACTQSCSSDSDCPAGYDCGVLVSGFCATAEEVSCKAVADIGKTCSADNQCGTSADNRSRVGACPATGAVFCRMSADPPYCSIPCDEAHDCPTGFTCSGILGCIGSWCRRQ